MRDAVSRHLNVWVSHTLGDFRHRRSSCNLLYLQIGRYISYLNIEESIRSFVDPSCRYAALKVRGATPGTGHAKGRAETRAHLRRNFVRFGSLLLSSKLILPRKEVIQPHVPVRLPCYDFTPLTLHTFGASPLAVGPATSGADDSGGVTGGVYKARERIHRGMLIRDY